MAKKYGGRIERWWKQELNDALKKKTTDMYGPNLGFMIHGYIGKDHKGRGFDNGPIRTSLVVKFSDKQIETLNTIYDLGEPLKYG